MNPSNSPETPSLEEHVASAVASHQRRLRLLSGAAWALGLLAAAASIIIVTLYFLAYLPKQKQILNDLGVAAGVSHVISTPAPMSPTPSTDLVYRGPDAHSSRQPIDFVGVQATMLSAISFGTMLIACAVGVLALGTLVVLVVVLQTRRATMGQIQSHLAQISAQLEGLRGERGAAQG